MVCIVGSDLRVACAQFGLVMAVHLTLVQPVKRELAAVNGNIVGHVNMLKHFSPEMGCCGFRKVAP